MRNRAMIQIAAVASLLAGAAGGLIATAPPAAAIQQCQGGWEYSSYVNVIPPPNPSISVSYFYQCKYGIGSIPQPVSISKYIGNGVWQVVASGSGIIGYTCTGGRYEYTTNVSQYPFYCG